MRTKTLILKRTPTQSSARSLLERLEGRVLFSTYTVTTLGDSAGSVVANGPGKFNATTLRAAIIAANAHAGADTINFKSGLAGTIALGKALPAVADATTLSGPGASSLTMRRSSSASTNFSIFHINSGTTATIQGITIAHGTGTVEAVGYTAGGGIYNSGNLTLAHCLFSNNSAVVTGNFGIGGAVYNDDGASLHVSNSSFTGNSAFELGGAIYNAGILSVTGSTFSSNSAGNQGDGGGLYNLNMANVSNCTFVADTAFAGGGAYNDGTLTVANSTFSGNKALQGNCAAIGNERTLTLVNCTLSGNVAPNSKDEGGGALCNYFDGNAILNNCTFSGNTAEFGGAIEDDGVLTLNNCTLSGNTATDIGGGMYIGIAGKVTLNNTIVVGNKSNPNNFAFSDEIYGAVNSASSFNVIGVVGTGGLHNGVNGNKVGVSLAALKLGALASNGGMTKTMALLPGSPAIDAGSNAKATAAGLVADQRGLPRIENGRVDVGALEVQKAGDSI